MNLLKPIDYIVYKISWIYRAGMDKYDPEVWARANFAFLILCNIYAILIWIRTTYYSKVWMYVCLAIFAFLFFYYNKARFKKIVERYKNEPPKQKLWGGIAVIVYVVVSIGMFFGQIISYMNSWEPK